MRVRPAYLNVDLVCTYIHNYCILIFLGWGGMVINATFNNISAISWQSALLVEETRVPGENHRPAESC